jgi:hypothetical protein
MGDKPTPGHRDVPAIRGIRDAPGLHVVVAQFVPEAHAVVRRVRAAVIEWQAIVTGRSSFNEAAWMLPGGLQHFAAAGAALDPEAVRAARLHPERLCPRDVTVVYHEGEFSGRRRDRHVLNRDTGVVTVRSSTAPSVGGVVLDPEAHRRGRSARCRDGEVAERYLPHRLARGQSLPPLATSLCPQGGGWSVASSPTTFGLAAPAAPGAIESSARAVTNAHVALSEGEDSISGSDRRAPSATGSIGYLSRHLSERCG